MSDELELPNGWAEAKFMDVFDIQGGTQPPKSTFIYEPRKGYVQLLQIRDFGEKPVATFIPDTDDLKKCTEDDILIARYGASLGRILTGLSGAYNVAMTKVDIPKDVHKRFVFYLLNSDIFQAPLRLLSRSAQNGFNKQDLSDFRIPIPPLEEQKRIAEKLERLLARVDMSLERLNRLPDILKRFRQAVLTAATSGELTQDWRAANKIELNWEDAQLSDICSFITDGDHQAPPQVKTGIPFITISAISDGRLNLDKASRFVSKEYFDSLKDNRKPTLGDVLFSVTGSIAIPALVDIEEVFTFQRHIAILKPDNTRVLSKFLLYTLSTENIKQQALQIATGTAQLTIPLSGLRSFTVRLPNLEEQAEIVKRVEKLFAFADKLETQFRVVSTYLDQFTSTLFTKAFRGELVLQDPNDEPASVLLDRIRMVREAEEVIKKNTKKKPSPRKEKIMKAKPVKAVTELSELIDRLGGEVMPERLLTESALEDNVDFFFELLREGRDKNILEVPVGRSDAIRRMVHADR